VTTVYVTHDQTEAMTMGDRIAVLDDGVLQQVGTPLECYHTPNNRFVAGFIGEPSMNFFPTTREGDELSAERFTYPLPEAVRETLGDATNVTLGVRPEDVEFATETDTLGPHDFECVVDVVEPVGESNNVYLRFADAPDGETFIATISGMRSVSSGDSVVATIPPDAIHLFDDRTGEALKNRSLDDVDGVDPT
jgi:multiple sugar transport system ATP-binding protein